MDSNRILYLYERYRNQQANTNELDELFLLVNNDLNAEFLKASWETEWTSITNQDLNAVSINNFEEIFESIVSQPQTTHSIKPLWSRIKGSVAIAAAVATVVFGVWFFKYRSGLKSYISSDVALVSNAKHILPGKNGATITLGNGKKIELSDVQTGVTVGKDLKYDDNSAVIPDEANEALSSKDKQSPTTFSLSAATAKGQTYIFTLSDGTKVWLNADSKITFARRFTDKTRDVYLEGEAYFEVAKDKNHPFIVATKGQQIEVLGTHFNVNSYKDESGIATTLLEGSVKIMAGNEQRIIKPGQQAFNKSGALSIREIDVDNVLDWKNGDFYLNHIEFKTAMRKIARWYDMDIIYDGSVPDNMESGGWISRDKPLSAVLKSIEASGLVKFKVDGRKIYVMQ